MRMLDEIEAIPVYWESLGIRETVCVIPIRLEMQAKMKVFCLHGSWCVDGLEDVCSQTLDSFLQ
jgi:hypothetical protein